MAGERSLNSEQTVVITQPVALGIGTAGVDLRAGAASRSPVSLRELLNARFVHDRSLGKRAGHTASILRTDDPYPQVDVEETRPWLYGWGDLSYAGFAQAVVKPPFFPEQTRGAGCAVLDDTIVASTGDRLLVKRTDNRDWLPSGGHLALIPTAKRKDRSYSGTTATDWIRFFETAVSAIHEVTVYFRGTVSNTLSVAVRDRETDAIIVEDVLLATGAVTNATVVYSAGQFVAIWAVGTDYFISHATDAAPETWSSPVVWDTGSGEFDVEVVSDDRFLVAFRDGVNIRLTYYRGSAVQDTPVNRGTAMVTSEVPTGLVSVAFGRNNRIGLFYECAAGSAFQCYTDGGAILTVAATILIPSPITKLAIAPYWNYAANGQAQFQCWTGATVVGALFNTPTVFADKLTEDGTVVFGRVYSNSRLATRGFRVGDIACVGMLWDHASGSFQATHFFVGHTFAGDYRVLGVTLRGESVGLTSIDWNGSGVRPEPGQGYNDLASPTTAKWVVSLLRFSPSFAVTTNRGQVVYSMDFLPPFRAAQFGRALYFPGAVTQSFDGRSVHEAGFNQYPEILAVISSAAGGAIPPGTIRAYRVYAVHTNASGEVSRSAAVTYIAPAVGVGNNRNAVTFTPLSLTGRDDVKFEIYATTAGPGATFYRIEPEFSNTLLNSSLTFNDTLSDASVILGVPDPHPPLPGIPGELLESAPPGAELVCAAKGRLWFSGGEIPRGRLVFTKLREETEQAGWDDLGGYLDLDSTGKPIVSLAVMNDVLVAFQTDGIYGLQGDGPNNLGMGSFPPAQLVVPGAGAVTHNGTTLTEVGLVFWAEAGPRLLSPGFSLTDISPEVEPLCRSLTSTLTSCVSVPGLREARWYTSGGTALMWDYSGRGEAGNRWSVWGPLATAGAVYYPKIGGAVIVTPTGTALFEDQTVTTDGGKHYEFAWRTGDVRPGATLQGNNRFVRMALVGEYKGPHTLGVWTYYDDSPMWDDYFTWVPENALAVGPWGVGDGTAFWINDTTTWIDPATQSPDGVYRFRRRLPRDKGALISIRVSDLGAANDSFVVNEVAFELAVESGLTVTPPRTFGGNPES